MKPGTFLLMLTIFCRSLAGQVIFSEPFDEANGSTSGTDNVGGVSWNTSCASCSPGIDWFEVRTNILECEDTNGPATWTTGNIDITPCSSNALITLTINAAGGMEECTSGCGCNCVDWVLVEYSINGGAFVAATSSAGGPCMQSCTGGNYTLIGDATTFPFNFAYCIPATGSTLVLRVTVQTWANGERYSIDNVNVECFSCVLPLEVTEFKAHIKNGSVDLKWQTLSETETQYFIVEKVRENNQYTVVDSVQATGGYSNQYSATDHETRQGINYYRIKQVNKNGTFIYTETVAINAENVAEFKALQLASGIQITGCQPGENIIITDVSGHIHYSFYSNSSTALIQAYLVPGFYIAYSSGSARMCQSVFIVH